MGRGDSLATGVALALITASVVALLVLTLV